MRNGRGQVYIRFSVNPPKVACSITTALRSSTEDKPPIRIRKSGEVYLCHPLLLQLYSLRRRQSSIQGGRFPREGSSFPTWLADELPVSAVIRCGQPVRARHTSPVTEQSKTTIIIGIGVLAASRANTQHTPAICRRLPLPR